MYGISLPDITYSDVLEIVILSYIMYHVILWFKQTRAWALLKGIVLVCVFAFVAYVLQMDTLLWLIQQTVSVGIIAIVIIFQPELRRGLERFGSKGIIKTLFSIDTRNMEERFSDETIDELVLSCFLMGQAKTGALIVIECDVPLNEFEQSGIEVDAVLSSALLINIFEKNTPLHDGAVVVRGNRVTAATCYLPLTDSTTLNKALGTRHRAALGASEETDALVIVVSEETGAVSVAQEGKLSHDITAEYLRRQLKNIQNQHEDSGKRLKKWKTWKGRAKRETHKKSADE